MEIKLFTSQNNTSGGGVGFRFVGNVEITKPKPIIFGTTVSPKQTVEFNINDEIISATSNNESSFEILDDKLPKNGITSFQVTDNYDYKQNIKTLFFSNFNTSKITRMSQMFCDCRNLTELDITCFDTSKVVRMWEMFQGCNRLASLSLSNFNTSQVTDMSQMFENCYHLSSLDLSNFNTSKVNSMDRMFNQCSRLETLDLTNFVVNSTTDMMFNNCQSLQTIKINSEGAADELIARIKDDLGGTATWDSTTKIITIG